MNKDLREQSLTETEPQTQDTNSVELNPVLLKLSEEKQKELVTIILEDYRNAMEARNKTDWGRNSKGAGISFDDKYADLIDLYEGEDQTRPEAWMCGRSLKIAQAVIEMMVARLTPAIWNENIHRWRGVEFTDKARVEAVNKIMNWVLNVWMKIGDNFVPKYVRMACMIGSAIAETRWEVTKRDLGQTETIPVMGEDGQPLMGADGQPMTLETKLLHMDERPVVDLIPITRFLTQPGATDIQKEPVIKIEDFYFYELQALQAQGLAENVNDKLMAKVDKSNNDPVLERLEEAERVSDQAAKRRSHLVESLVWYGPFDADDDGFAEEICAMIAKNEEVYLRSYKTSSISRRGKRPFTHTPFIERLHKLFGIGLLEQIKPLAQEIDACFRQLQDANTLSIMRWGFYDPNSDYDPGEHVAKPRAMYPVTNPTQNVYFPDVNIPTERLLNAIRLVLEFVERLTAASSYMMGKESEVVGGSGTATRTQAITGAAEVRFNLPAANLRTGMAEILTDIFDMCFLNMPDGLEKRIVGEDGATIFDSSQAVRDALVQEMDAYLAPNPSFGDVNTERELAVLLYDKFVMGGNPLVVQDMSRLWQATADIYKAYGRNPVEYIGKAPSKKPTNDPDVEHTLFRQGEIVHAEPQENHLEHIMVHNKFLQALSSSTDILLWPKEAIEAIRLHIQEHQQMMTMIMQFQQGAKKGADREPAGANQPGETAASFGDVASAPGQYGVSSDASASRTSPQNQVAGTQSGSPAVR